MNENLILCKKSLLRGISGDLFEASDPDQKPKLEYSLDGISFLGIEQNPNKGPDQNKLTIALLNSSYSSDKTYEV